MIALWRLERLEKYVSATFQGIGSFRTGGRWNPRGYAVMYTSQNLSLAALEVLVHVPYLNPISEEYLDRNISFAREIIFLKIDEKNLDIEEVNISMLPNGWRSISTVGLFCDGMTSENSLTILQRIGKNWLDSNSTPILKVPSAIIPQEFNYLINPKHPQINERFRVVSQYLDLDPDIQLNDIEISHKGKLHFDDRLLVGRKLP